MTRGGGTASSSAQAGGWSLSALAWGGYHEGTGALDRKAGGLESLCAHMGGYHEWRRHGEHQRTRVGRGGHRGLQGKLGSQQRTHLGGN